MRSSWTYNLGENIISIEKEEIDLGVVTQNNLEKHINRIFGDTFRMLSNIHMTFHFLDKDMIRKIITKCTIIRPKLEYAEVIRKSMC